MSTPLSLKPGLKVLEGIVGVDALKPRLERFHTIEEGLRDSRQMLSEVTKVGRFVQKHGFSPGRDFFRMATIPSSVWSAVMEVFGDEWNAADMQERRRIFLALIEGPLRDYDMRKKPTLT